MRSIDGLGTYLFLGSVVEGALLSAASANALFPPPRQRAFRIDFDAHRHSWGWGGKAILVWGQFVNLRAEVGVAPRRS